ncbi:tetratricopeptide repeat protein [Nucisporomicrobium flavum]|uniref:tetratricopeptide repeat protein n=1 Tax=Nucisporomicrobium flavum TaxID=2785915 RepID=UPI0018F76C13|nr:tetratricopeptide repeat protein [Nucisporomicrobium flavum]
MALLTSLVGTSLSITGNLASDVIKLPPWLSWVQDHPVWASLALTMVMFALWAAGHFLGEAGPQPATGDELAGTAEGLHDQLGRIEISQMENDDRILKRLPPLARQIIEGDIDHQSTWQVIVGFTRDATDPFLMAREWAVAPPAGADALSADGQLCVAEILLAYGQPKAALRFIRAALDLGVTPRLFWLFRAHQIAGAAEDETTALALLDEADQIDPSYPLTAAARLNHAGQWEEAASVLAQFRPTTDWERDAAALVASVVFANLERLNDAVTALDSIADRTLWSGNLLTLARLLMQRSQTGGGDSRWKDAARARELALHARNMRRSWRGDSAEAVAAAAEAMFVGDDPAAVWTITRPPLDGEATPAEAADARVLSLAAIAAAVTGRPVQAEQLAAESGDEFVKLQVSAEILAGPSLDGQPRPPESAIEAWKRVADAATTDGQRLHALRYLALSGASHPCAEAMREKYPDAMADIDQTREIFLLDGPEADNRLRGLEHKSPLASIRRAELIRAIGDLPRAAQVLVDATQRWEDPRLLLMATDCYMQDGDWVSAKEVARQTIAEAGSLWPGRATALRRLVDIEIALHDWTSAIAACRSLLELDDEDDDARWNLALCQFRDGDPQAALQTLQRHGLPQPTTPQRALFLLDLIRRFGDAAEVARTALAQLRAFPDDEALHLAAMNAINTRIDRTDLPEPMSLEVSDAWTTFFERYPASNRITTYTFDDNVVPADMEAMLRAQAASYQTIRNAIINDLLPIGMLSPLVGKPYAAIFPYRPLGYNRIASPIQQDLLIETQHARDAIDHDCLLDASALFTLALIPDVATTLLQLLGRGLTTAAGLEDILSADDYFNLPSAGTLGFDPDQDRLFATETDDDIRQRQRQQIKAMLTHARHLRRVGHSTLLHLPTLFGDPAPTWLINTDAAKSQDIAFWCDDLGLRRLAHAHGVRTFGTASLLDASVEGGHLADGARRRALHTLTVEYAVDLPFDLQLLTDVAAEGQWQPGPVTTILSRPAAWTHPEQAAAVLRAALRQAPPDATPAWIQLSLRGLHDASPEEHRRTNLIGVATALICEPWARPEHLQAIESALQKLMPEAADEVLRAIFKDVWRRLSKQHPVDEAVLIIVHLISSLTDIRRQAAIQLVLQAGQP